MAFLRIIGLSESFEVGSYTEVGSYFAIFYLGCILLGLFPTGYSYSGLGITEYTEFKFGKECSYMFQIWKRNRR